MISRRDLLQHIEWLRTRLAYVEGELDAMRKAFESMRQLASEALALAERVNDKRQIPSKPDKNSAANYVPPKVQNCPRCAVSIRAEAWPQQCPACRTMFNSDGSLDVLESGEIN